MTERLIDIWRSKTNSLTELAVREFLLGFRRDITLADARGEKRIRVVLDNSIIDVMMKHYRRLPEIRAEIGELSEDGFGRALEETRERRSDFSGEWFNDAFIEALDSEGFIVKHQYLFPDDDRPEKEILLAMGEAQHGPIPMPPGGWTWLAKYENFASRRITLCWD